MFKKIFLLTVILFSLSLSVCQEKDYYLSSYTVEIRVLNGGHLNITEEISFTFTKGTFTYAYREIPLRKIESIENITVQGVNTEVTDLKIEKSFGKVKITWRYPKVCLLYTSPSPRDRG